MDGQKFCLKWDGFQSSVTSVFDQLRAGGELLDVTLCCEGQRVKAHRMMLSACSPYFRDLLRDLPGHQLAIFLKDTSSADLTAIVEFMYKGSVNVSQSQLASFIKTAETLQIRGLSGDDDKPPEPAPNRSAPAPAPPPPPAPRHSFPPPAKRRRASDCGDAPLSSGPAGGAGWPRTPGSVVSPAPHRPETPVLLSGSSNQSAPSPPPGAASPAGRGQGDTPPASSRVPLAAAAGASPARSERAVSQDVSDNIKVEKVELSDGEDTGGDGSLDAALGRLAEMDGAYGGPTPTGVPHGVSFSSARYGMPVPSLPGPSQHSSPAAPHPEDGSAHGSAGRPVFVCNDCGRHYSNKQALTHHAKVHQGLTTCKLCGKVLCIVAHLRRHLVQAHNLSPSQVQQLVPAAKSRVTEQPLAIGGPAGSGGRFTTHPMATVGSVGNVHAVSQSAARDMRQGAAQDGQGSARTGGRGAAGDIGQGSAHAEIRDVTHGGENASSHKGQGETEDGKLRRESGHTPEMRHHSQELEGQTSSDSADWWAQGQDRQ